MKYSQKTLHSSPERARYGVSFVSSKGNILCRLVKIELYKIFAIINRAIKGLHCTLIWYIRLNIAVLHNITLKFQIEKSPGVEVPTRLITKNLFKNLLQYTYLHNMNLTNTIFLVKKMNGFKLYCNLSRLLWSILPTGPAFIMIHLVTKM